MKLKSTILATALIHLFSVMAQADIQSGDKLSCYDSVSNYKYEIKVQDIGDESAWVRVRLEGNPIAFYSEANTELDFYRDSVSGDSYMQVILLEDGNSVGALSIPDSISFTGRAFGIYRDGGDSRSIECVVK